MNLIQKKKQLEKLEKEIKVEEREISIDKLAKELKKDSIGNYYKFKNNWIGSHEHWFIYKEVKDVKLVNNSVYMIVDSYQKDDKGTTTIKLNEFEIQNDSWDRGWDWIKKEEFVENKNIIVRGLK